MILLIDRFYTQRLDKNKSLKKENNNKLPKILKMRLNLINKKSTNKYNYGRMMKLSLI
jgi:hypothetical protein